MDNLPQKGSRLYGVCSKIKDTTREDKNRVEGKAMNTHESKEFLLKEHKGPKSTTNNIDDSGEKRNSMGPRKGERGAIKVKQLLTN